jgi:thiol-disulfide isomerase/thioredoxin
VDPENFVPRRTALAVLAAAAVGGTLHALNNREPAPRFTATTLDGEKFTNDSVKGKVVLLQFWATWCQYCRRDQPAVDAIVHDFPGTLIVLAVDVGESKKKVRQYLEDSPRACKVVLTENTNLAAMYAAKSFPLYVVIDKDGNVAGTQRGAGGEDSLRRLLKKAGLAAESE